MRRLEQHTHFLAWLCSALQCKARRACKACKACKARQASTHLCHPAGRLSEGSIRPLHVLTHLLPSFCPLLPDGARDQSRHLIRRQLLHMHTLTSCASIRRAIWAMCVGLLSRGRCWLCASALILTNSIYLCRSPGIYNAMHLSIHNNANYTKTRKRMPFSAFDCPNNMSAVISLSGFLQILQSRCNPINCGGTGKQRCMWCAIRVQQGSCTGHVRVM